MVMMPWILLIINSSYVLCFFFGFVIVVVVLFCDQAKLLQFKQNMSLIKQIKMDGLVGMHNSNTNILYLIDETQNCKRNYTERRSFYFSYFIF